MIKYGWILFLIVALMASPLLVLAQDGGDEVETFASEDELLTFDYPVGWLAEDLGSPYPSVAVANSDEAMERRIDGSAVETGDQVITMVLLPLEFVSMMGLNLPEDDLEALALAAQPLFSTQDYPVEWGEIEIVELDVTDDETLELAFMPATTEDADGVFYLGTVDDFLLIVTVEAYPDEYSDELETLSEQIIPTLAYDGTADDVMTSIIEALNAPVPTAEAE
jgi:hypothetical protein